MTLTSNVLALHDREHNIIRAPKVRLLAKTEICDRELMMQIRDYNYPSYTGDHDSGEYLIEYAGRRCYESFHNPAGRSTTEYIGNILAHRHYSVLEHTHCTFDISGVSRSFTHELIRHRHFNYSQLSQRYVDSKNANYICPPAFLESPQLFHEWEKAVHENEERLRKLEHWATERMPQASRKQIREATRAIVYNCIETRIVVTGNLRSWREMLEKRWNYHADAEIERVAGLVGTKLKEVYPAVFVDVDHIGE